MERARTSDEQGFTLIELLVVVIIIGILAAIAIPTFLNQREKAWQKAAHSDLRNAVIQAEDQVMAAGTYLTVDATLIKTRSDVRRAGNDDRNEYCTAADHDNL